LRPYKHRAVFFVLIFPTLGLTPGAFASTEEPPPAAPAAEAAPEAGSDHASLAEALCRLKQKIGARKGTWTAAQCDRLADAVLASAARHDLSPALVVAVMIQESDLDDRAARVSRARGRLAKDSGLMGIRCVLDRRGRCTNGLVRGMAWRAVMDPATNIDLGARYLAHYRDGATRCRHRDHAYWAHYNHGTRYISRGPARLYPREVAALYAAVGQLLGVDTSELARLRATAPCKRSAQLCTAIRRAAASDGPSV
jgi:hypothetical protein